MVAASDKSDCLIKSYYWLLKHISQPPIKQYWRAEETQRSGKPFALRWETETAKLLVSRQQSF